MNIIKGVAVRKLSRQFSASLAVVALCVIVLGVVTELHVSDVRDSWNQYAHVKQGKRALINDLTATVGFDGAVHHFENLILRRDADGIDKVVKEFGKAQALIREYRALNLTAKETQALNDVSAVVADYQRAVREVSVMIDSNATISEIDQSVTIDDSLALGGLAVLSDVVSEDITKIASKLEEDLSLIESHTLFGTIISSIALCVLLAFLIVTFRTILLQIGGEPQHIMSIASRIADGDLSEALHDVNKSTGIYAAVVSIQSNLRDIAEREEASLAHSEQLRQALDNASSNVMVADTDNNIIFINKASRELFQSREKEIISTMPHFKASEIVGSNIDIFHKQPEMQKSIVRNLSSTHKTAIEFGGCTFSFFINPVVTESGRRLGTIVEWFDKTNELKNEAEVQLLVQAAARGDLSKRINTEHSTDFFQVLGQSMNELMDVNDSAVGEVQRVFAAIARGDLTATVEGEYQGVYQQLKNDANATVNQLTEVITNVKNSAMIIAAASSELISTNKNLNETAEDGAKQAAIATTAASNVTDNVNAVAHAATEMESSGKEITRNVTEAVDVASQAVTLAQSTNAQVRKLTTSSSDIGNVIKVINSIAEQTNLLALNATIEAARAGDAGKGFAVVANEVKELAKGTAKATDEIAQKINAIQGDSDTAVQAIGDISAIIETISNYQNTISAAVQNQNLATQRISKNASEAASGNVEITQTSKRVSEGTESTVRGVSEVQTSAEELSRMAVGLSSLVDSFQVDSNRQRSEVKRAA